MCHCRLFHLVIQLFSHLVDVPASNSGARAHSEQKRWIHEGEQAARGCRLERWEVLAGFRGSVTLYWFFLCPFLSTWLHLAESIWSNFVPTWVRKLSNQTVFASFYQIQVEKIFSKLQDKESLEDKDSLSVFCLIFLSFASHLSWKICGPNIIKRN